MADMGYGVNREIVMRIAYTIVEKTGRKHSFTGDSAGRSWFEGFRRRHPELTIRTPLPLSYNRAVSASPDVVSEFFGKVGALYGRLNLFSKPNQIYNTDETGVSVVHRPGIVIAQGFDIPDPGYVAWLKINHPEIALSTTGTSTTMSSQPNSASPLDKQQAASPDVLDEVLVLPVP
uniref:HTH CENPB-type domain-containing protein n=1 Tax=Amphimedon queenslandica TaxID=400682 RepID=A0A1X7TTS3_AMPQE